MDSRVAEEVSIADLFDQFIEASTMKNVLSIHHRILNYADLNPCEFDVFFPKLKRAVMSNRLRKNWKAKALFSKIDKKAAHRCYSNTKAPTPVGNRSSDNQNNSHNSQECINDSMSSQSNRAQYNNNALQHYNCLVIGSGPAGLRTAIELQLLGASRVVVVEKRSRFSRNNVLHLWPFVIDDLKSLGAKKFYGKFCAGSIDHISIRQLQLILLKICLMIGCDFRDSCSYLYLCPSSIKQTLKSTKETHSDTVKANGTSDSVESITQLCDLDEAKPSKSVDFAKVSCFIKDESNQNEESNQAYKTIKDENTSTQLPNEDGLKLLESNYQPIESNLDVASGSNVPSIKINQSQQSDAKERDISSKRGENLRGAFAHFQSDYKLQEKELHSYEWDIIIGADGRRNTLSKFFPRKEFRGRLAIAITANFINRQTPAEASVSEISGLSFIYNQDMFNALAYDTNIQLENICYYKDDTHYFVMTAKKRSLLDRGVLISDYATTQDLLSESNIDRQALFKYAKDAAYWTTGLEPLDFALNHYGQEDCAMFDFTSMYAASNACKALRTKEGGLSLISLVGDSLLEPFWPTGSGCARGFLSSFDAAWMCRQWAVNKCAVIDYHHSISSRSSRTRSSTGSDRNRPIEPSTYNRMALSVMAERESIYRILAQTTSENLQQNYSLWTLNPHTRYPNLNRHLVMPAQVEHLITDNDGKINLESQSKGKLEVIKDRPRRIKSPIAPNSRKSPKKLKSANASPVVQAKDARTRARQLSKNNYKSKSSDITLDETYIEFEQSYNNLSENEKGAVQYLNYRRPDCDIFDDIFVPSISGTLPSSNNLLSLEARRARDIDECLRQRRQKTQISVVREQLIGHLRKDIEARPGSGNDIIPGNAALFNELRRLKEQQAKGKENRSRDANGPLSLLNSIRRCASFAERVKSFENKLGSSSQESTVPTTPKTPIDDVKNLPQFATLQEIFVSNSTSRNQTDSPKKPKIPIMKLSKDDWNVKCWEKRLVSYRQKGDTSLSGSTKSLNKAISVDSYHSSKPEKQVEVFKDRIKEMSDKLEIAKDSNQVIYSERSKTIEKSSYLKDIGRSQGWVSHIRRELIKGVEAKPHHTNKQPMNPAIPNKPIKKLFEDDDDNDDGIDINKHYDHLCINRPTNKYLSKSNYTSHLTRVKYNSVTSKVINRKPDAASKQAYMAALTSRGSSASSTVSDYSTNTGESSSGFGKQQGEVKCSRCRGTVNIEDRITIGDSVLHRTCLICAECGITLRTNEIQHYLEQMKGVSSEPESSFVCAICKPNIRAELSKEAADRLDRASINWQPEENLNQSRLKSREEFLNEKINYNELYKNILNPSANNDRCTKSSSQETTPTVSSSQINNRESQSSQDYEDAVSRQEARSVPVRQEPANTLSPSPTKVTLPLKLVTRKQNGSEDRAGRGDKNDDGGYRIARSETIDGSEQVTLTLPLSNSNLNRRCGSSDSISGTREMIDEEELQRILHLDNSTNKEGHGTSDSSNSKDGSSQNDDGCSEREDSSDDNQDNEDAICELSDDPSSLNSPPNTDEYDDEDDNDNDFDRNSTYEDFLTSEEFGAVSDRDDNEGQDCAEGGTQNSLRRESNEHGSEMRRLSVSNK